MSKAKIVSFIFYIFLIILALYFILAFFFASAKNEYPRFFGLSLHIVVSDSMQGEIEVGELLLAKQYDINKVKVGDNVLFKSKILSNKIIVHKVVEIDKSDGEVKLTTQGVKSGAPIDPNPITKDNFYGLEIGHSVFWGKIYLFISSPISLILISVSILSIIYGTKIIRKLKASAENEQI